MQHRLLGCGLRIVFGLLVFAVLATAILIRPAKWLGDFDQSFYLTIAYDLNHHGVFSNGVFDKVNSTVAVPSPGIFFGPVYPWLIVAATKIDGRFAQAVDCSVQANASAPGSVECDVYARPMHIMHAAFLTLGVIAIALAAELIFASSAVFWLAGSLATVALLPSADLFSFVMTESITFSLYSIAALALVLALKAPSVARIVLVGLLFGMLCLTRPSFVVLAPVAIGLIAINDIWFSPARWRAVLIHGFAFVLAWLVIVGPWLVRNAVSAGKWGLTEEYGSAALIERFAFDDMTAREFMLAFPYCLPGIGEPVVNWAFGPQAMARFVYDRPGSFFEVGRLHRDKLVEGSRTARSADQGPDPRRDGPTLVALPSGEPAFGLVRHVGRRVVRARAGAAVRLRLRDGRAPLQAPVPAVRGPGRGHARPARGRRQPLYPLQSHPDRAVRRGRRLDFGADRPICVGGAPAVIATAGRLIVCRP